MSLTNFSMYFKNFMNFETLNCFGYKSVETEAQLGQTVD